VYKRQDIDTLNQPALKIDKSSENWKKLPVFVKLWFVINFLQVRPQRNTALRVEVISHITGFLFCGLGLVSKAALVGGLIMLGTAYLFLLLRWQGDRFGIWYEKAV
jgi:hypothetical protein